MFGNSSFNILVAYYSFTGNTSLVADAISNQCQSDILHIKDKKKRAGILGYLKSGYESFTNVKSEIEYSETNLTDYDLIILGTPVWMGNVASPMRTFIVENKNKFQKTAFLKLYFE